MASPETLWVVRTNFANPTRTNQVHSMVFDHQGNILVAGSAPSAAGGDLDYALIKYTQSGQVLWKATYGSAPGAVDWLRHMVLDPQGNVYVTGTSRTVKYDSNGVLQWVANHVGRGLAFDTNGFVYVVGASTNDFITVKLSATEGTNVWSRTYDYSGRPDVAQKVALGPAGEVYVGGMFSWLCDHLGCYVQFGLVKYDANGGFQWSKLWEPPNTLHTAGHEDKEMGVRNAVVMEDRVYLAGNFRGGTDESYVVGGFDASGTNVYQFSLPGTETSAGMRGFAFNISKEIFMTGQERSDFPITRYVRTVRVGTNATVKWQTYSTQSSTTRRSTALALDSADNSFIAGQISPNTFGTQFDFLVVKYDANGRELWQKEYGGPAGGNDIGMGILVAPDGGIFVSGHSANASGGNDFVLIKYLEVPAIVWQGTQVLLQFCATNGQPCRFQASTNLVDWQDLATVPPDTNGICRYTDTAVPAHPRRFYRTATP